MRTRKASGPGQYRPVRAPWWLCALPLLMAGCAQLPDWQGKAALEPAAPNALLATPTAQTTDWPQAQWWQRYGNPQLDDLIAEALQGAPDMQAAAARVQQAQAMMSAMMSSNASSGPVNWRLASDTALQAYASEDPEVSVARQSAITDASYLADLWLNNSTVFEAGSAPIEAWTRKRWYDKTLGTWKKITEPVAESVAQAITSAMKDQIPEEMKGMLGNADGMFRNLGASMFGMQLGSALGELAKDVLGGTDIGLPLAGTTPGIVATNVSAFGDGLEIPEQEVLLYAVLRESAHARLFNRVPWLSSKLIGAVESYARGIHIDMSRIEEAVRGIDPSNPEALQSMLGEGLFTPQRTQAQDKALENLELTLALIEGWVDHVVSEAAQNLPFAGHLRETMRRRRASGGPRSARSLPDGAGIAP